MIYDVPSYSPWGEVQNYDQLCPGVYCVSTAGHGGGMGPGSSAPGAIRSMSSARLWRTARRTP